MENEGPNQKGIEACYRGIAVKLSKLLKITEVYIYLSHSYLFLYLSKKVTQAYIEGSIMYVKL